MLGLCAFREVSRPSVERGVHFLVSSQNPDGSWSYVTDTVLTVHGRDAPFAHRDQNTLTKIGEAAPNPLAVILAKRKASVRPPA